MLDRSLTRRATLVAGVAAVALPGIPGALAQPTILGRTAPREFDLALEHRSANITGRSRPAMAINGVIPGPILRFREGEEVVIRVANRLREETSIHWHGLIIPSSQDGVPGVSDGFQGIPAGTEHTYRFPLIQSGTYWYHSHSATQEQSGIYGPLIIDPIRAEPYRFDRDYVVMLSDWTDEVPRRVVENLKRDPGYYNYNRRTLASLVRELREAPDAAGRQAAIRERIMWGDMRMDPTDIEDVTGYTFLVNGRTPAQNFTALFRPGEAVRLRFINAGAMTHFDLRIPGLELTVVHVHGNDVVPVTVDELRIAPAETYDVIVRPREDRQYQILAESMGRQGFAQASLATREGLPALPLPPHRARPILTMADMAMSPGPTGLDRGTLRPEVDRPGQITPAMDMGGMDHGSMAAGGATGGANHAAMGHGAPAAGSARMAQAGPGQGGMDHSNMPGMGGQTPPVESGRRQEPSRQLSNRDQRGAAPPAAAMDHAAMGHGTAPAATDHSAMGHSGDPRGGDAFTSNTGAPPGARVLSMRDLRALRNPYPLREPDRVLEVRLTGNMERYFWGINGNRFSEAQPIVLRLGERVRMRFINETMMSHPMHLHGLWMQPQVGNEAQNPLLHVINVRPNTTIDVDVEADAEGGWAFHCHMLYHMETGMMRAVRVVRDPAKLAAG